MKCSFKTDFRWNPPQDVLTFLFMLLFFYETEHGEIRLLFFFKCLNVNHALKHDAPLLSCCCFSVVAGGFFNNFGVLPTVRCSEIQNRKETRRETFDRNPQAEFKTEGLELGCNSYVKT